MKQFNKRGFSYKALSFGLTALIIGILLFIGPVKAFFLDLGIVDDEVVLGERVIINGELTFEGNDQFLPIKNFTINIIPKGPINGTGDLTCSFDINGDFISPCKGMKIINLSLPDPVQGYGYGYGYSNNQSFNFGYGYGVRGTVKYTIVLHSTSKTAILYDVENYNAEMSSVIGNERFISETENFRITHGQITICHNQQTINIDTNVLRIHLAHGDTIGACAINRDLVFEDAVLLSNSTEESHLSQIEIDDGGHMNIVWVEKISATENAINHKKINRKNGQVLIHNVLENHLNLKLDYLTMARDDQDNLHIIYALEKDVNGTITSIIRYIKVDKNGNTLLNDQLSSLNKLVRDLKVVSDVNNNLHLTWQETLSNGDKQIMYNRYDNNGNAIFGTFGLFITQGNVSIIPQMPSIGVDSQVGVYIAWEETSNLSGSDIYYSKLSNFGFMLVNRSALVFGHENPRSVDISVDRADNVFFAWSDDRTGINEIYYSKMLSTGLQLAPIRVSNSIGAFHPQIDITPIGEIDLIWFEQVPGELHFMRFDNFGELLLSDKILETIGLINGPPRLNHDRQGAVYLTWADFRQGNSEVYYKNSKNSAFLELNGTPSIGSTITFKLEDIYNIQGEYFLGISTDGGTRLVLKDGQIAPINNTPFLQLSLYNPQLIGLQNSQGFLDETESVALFTIPNIQELIGTTFYAAFGTTDSKKVDIVTMSEEVKFTIVS